MPHFQIQYSANLDERTDMQGLCEAVRSAALATGTFEIGAIRVRAMRCEHFAIADLHPDNAFVDCVLRMGEGRPEDERRRAGEAVFKAMQERLANLLATPHFALSFSIEEIDSRFSWKHNAIHPRLRGKT